MTVLREYVRHDLAMNVRQPKIATRVAEGKLLVVEPQEMQDRGVQVMHVNFVRDGFVTKLVSLPVCNTGFNTSTC